MCYFANMQIFMIKYFKHREQKVIHLPQNDLNEMINVTVAKLLN